MKDKNKKQRLIRFIKTLWTKTDKLGIILLISFGIFLYILFKKYFLTDESAINKILNNLFQFSGIFSALLITFLIGKVLQTRQERIERRKEIVRLSNKLTDFRRIARVLVQCHEFWDKGMRGKIQTTYKNLTFFDLHNWDYDNEDKKYSKELRELRSKFLKEDNIPGAYMFLDMKSLVLDEQITWQLELYDKHDHDYTYSFEILDEWANAHSGNKLWYCLEDKRAAYEDCFKFHAFRRHEIDEILQLAKKIDLEKYSNREFDSSLLADIGGEMASFYIPRLQRLTYYNTKGLSRMLNFLLAILFITIVTGVLTPLILTSIKVEKEFLRIVSCFLVSTLCLSLFYFLIKFKKILNDEIKIG